MTGIIALALAYLGSAITNESATGVYNDTRLGAAGWILKLVLMELQQGA